MKDDGTAVQDEKKMEQTKTNHMHTDTSGQSINV